MVVDHYRGYWVYRLRDTNYRVLDGKEEFQVFDEGSGRLAFAFLAFYNPKRILRPEDKEGAIAALMAPALEAVRGKIDAGDLTDGQLHVETRAAAMGPTS